MEDKRTAIAIFACIVFIMFYSEMFLAPVTRHQPVATQSASPSQQASQPAASAPISPAVTNSASVPVPVAPENRHPNSGELLAASKTLIESNEASIEITHLGARLSRFKLKQYKLHMGADDLVDMVASAAGTALPLAVQIGNINDDFVAYTLSSVSAGAPRSGEAYGIPEAGELALVFNGSLPNGIGIQKTLRFRPGSYLFDVEVALATPAADGSRVALDWAQYAADVEINNRLDPPQFSHLTNTGKLHHLVASEAKTSAMQNGKVLSDLGQNQWIASGGKYFMSAVIPAEQANSSFAGVDQNTLLLRAYGTGVGGKFSVYVGPKDYRVLKSVNYELHRSIDLGWFSFLAFPLISIIRFFHHLLGNYGLAIILLTLVIKALFLPLTKASFASMRAMQELQPEVKALRERIKDATQLNQEMMALYKRKGVNPMGGCLPILIQLPVFLGLYNALLNSIELRHAPFALWIQDLSAPEALIVAGIGVPVMVLLMGASMFLQQLTTPSTGDPAQRKVMLMMPIIFTVMFVIFPFPAGLVLYWLVNNIISIIQQVYLMQDRKANPMQATAVASIAIFFFGWALTLIK